MFYSAHFRSRHRRCSVKIGVFRNFAKFAGKHLCQILFFNKVAGLKRATLLKKRFWYRCFPVNFAKFLISPFLQNTSWRLLLKGLFMSGNKMFPLHPSGFYLYTIFFSFYKVLPPISQECLLISQECLLNFYFREKCHSKTLVKAFQKTLEAVAQRCS